MTFKQMTILFSVIAGLIFAALMVFIVRPQLFPKEMVIKYHPSEEVAFNIFKSYWGAVKSDRIYSLPFLVKKLKHPSQHSRFEALRLLLQQPGNDGVNALIKEISRSNHFLIKDPRYYGLPSSFPENKLRLMLAGDDQVVLGSGLLLLAGMENSAERTAMFVENIDRVKSVEVRKKIIVALRSMDNGIKEKFLELYRKETDKNLRLACLMNFFDWRCHSLTPEETKFFWELASNPGADMDERRQAAANLLHSSNNHIEKMLANPVFSEILPRLSKELIHPLKSSAAKETQALGFMLQGENEIGESLLSQSTNINASNWGCYTVLDLALAVRDERIVTILRKHGAGTGIEIAVRDGK